MSDARKQIWKFQEGAVVLALRECCGEEKVHWDHTPEGMSIDPDVLIGDIPNSPEATIFVTHATAERCSEKKFWRTVAEVVEAKRLGSKPRVISVLFSSNVKNDLLAAYVSLFDAVVHLDEYSWGNTISNSLAKLTKLHGNKSKKSCIEVLSNQIIAQKIPHWRDFTMCMDGAVSSKVGPYHDRIASSSFKQSTRIPGARETTLRRSACKYYTIPGEIRKNLHSGARIERPPEHAIVLEWVSRSIGGFRLTDTELNNCLNTTEKPVLESIVDHIDSEIPRFREYTNSLRNISGRVAVFDWIIDNHETLSTPEGMLIALNEIYEDAESPLKDRLTPELMPTDNWLFSGIMMLLRTETGRRDGYGYSQLGLETGFEDVISAHPGVAVAPFIQRRGPLEPKLAKGIAKVFSSHLKRLGRTKCEELAKTAVFTTATTIFNYQIVPYRHFNPLEWLVCDQLSEFGHLCEFPSQHPSFLANAGKQTSTSTGNIISVNGGMYWIKCQSGYAGKIDKRKELCGRIGAMKLCYTPKELEQKRFFLVIDGFFDDHDLALLDQAGWDGIFYFDELDSLIEAIGEG